VLQWGWRHNLRTMFTVGNVQRRAPWLVRLLQKINFGRITLTDADTSPLVKKPFGEIVQRPHQDSEANEEKEKDKDGSEDEFVEKKVVWDEDKWTTETLHAVTAATGGEQMAVVTADGSLFTWGSGFHGQCGHGDDITLNLLENPRRVEAMIGHKVVEVACGFQHTVILTEKGDVFVCGKLNTGALGLPNHDPQTSKTNRIFLPTRVQDDNKGIGRVVGIAAGFNHTVLLDEQGRVWTTGKNAHGQLGLNNNFDDQYGFVQVEALAGHEVKQVAAGQYHTMALTGDNVAWTWGANKSGQCGRPLTDAIINHRLVVKHPNLVEGMAIMTPGPVELDRMLFEDRRVPPVAGLCAGFFDSVLLLEDGQCIAFGGNGESDNFNPPTAIMPGVRANDVAFGIRSLFVLGHYNK